MQNLSFLYLVPVAYLEGGGACGHPPLRKSENIFWRDTLLEMGFQTYIFCSKVPSKCRKCRFRDPNFKKFPGGHAPGPPYNCVVTMASPSLKSWLRHCFVQCSLFDTNSRSKTYKCMWLFLCLRATKNYKVSKITVIFIHNIHILISNAYFPIFQRGLQPQ